MRLLEIMDDGLLTLTGDLDEDAVRKCPYAILSHTWGDEEVTFQDFMQGTGDQQAGYAKIEFCKIQAKREHIRYFWVDTCCIDKSSAVELQTAIASMFRWYRNAKICYVFMSDFSRSMSNTDSEYPGKGIPGETGESRWFTRGWTLQELLAPREVKFFSREGNFLGSRSESVDTLHEITRLPKDALRGQSLDEFSKDERFQWTEKRTTTRKEDLAYSLLGMFDVQMPLFYGEGEGRAFFRLNEAIEKSRAERYKLPLYGGTRPSAEEERSCLKSLWCRDSDAGLALILTAINTCDWVFEHAAYRKWLFEQRGLLWIKGCPGSGKSVLMKHIITRMRMNDSKVLTACFSLDSPQADGAGTEITPVEMFRTLLHTLLDRFGKFKNAYAKTFQEKEQRYGEVSKKERAWSEKELSEALQDALIQIPADDPVTVFVDALDALVESSESRLFKYFYNLAEQVKECQVPVKICIVSRHSSISGNLEVPTINVDEHNRKDIEYFVRQSVKTDKKIHRDPLYARYTSMLAKGTDDEKEQRSKLFTWMLCSWRPLTTYELREALAFNDTYELREAFASDEQSPAFSIRQIRTCPIWIKDTIAFEEYMTSLSGNLVQFTSHEAEFLHSSVREFLSTRTPNPVAGGQADAQLKFSKVCLHYLCLKDVLEGYLLNQGDLIRTFPLAAYAAEFVSRFAERSGMSLRQWTRSQLRSGGLVLTTEDLSRLQQLMETLLQEPQSSLEIDL